VCLSALSVLSVAVCSVSLFSQSFLWPLVVALFATAFGLWVAFGAVDRLGIAKCGRAMDSAEVIALPFANAPVTNRGGSVSTKGSKASSKGANSKRDSEGSIVASVYGNRSNMNSKHFETSRTGGDFMEEEQSGPVPLKTRRQKYELMTRRVRAIPHPPIPPAFRTLTGNN
jgi:hypothetical protein